MGLTIKIQVQIIVPCRNCFSIMRMREMTDGYCWGGTCRYQWFHFDGRGNFRQVVLNLVSDACRTKKIRSMAVRGCFRGYSRSQT